MARKDRCHRSLRAQQQIKRDHVRDHQHRHINDRYHIGGTQLSRHKRQTRNDRVVVVDENVGGA